MTIELDQILGDGQSLRRDGADLVGFDPATQADLAAISGTYAPLASPTFTGDPKAPTPPQGDNDTTVATTAFVHASRSGVFASNATDTTVANTTTETDLLSQSIDGVQAGDLYTIRAWGEVLNDTGSTRTVTFKLKLGATTVLETNGASVLTNAAVYGWSAEVQILVPTLTTQEGSGVAHVAASATSRSWGSFASNHSATVARGFAATEDWSTAKTLALTGTLSVADAALSVTCKGYVVERARPLA